MSKESLIKSLVSELEEAELYRVAKFYLEEVEGISNIFVTNGPYDAGIDLAKSSFGVQVQATVQKTQFEKKLSADLSKAIKNCNQYQLPNKVYYFYSGKISNAERLNLRKRYKDELGLYLILIDGNLMAEAASQYDELAKLIYDLSKVDDYKGTSTYFDDVKVKSYYDLMSFGKTTDIKFNVIKSFVLNYLFNNQDTGKSELLTATNSHFGSSIYLSYFDTVLARLSSEHKIRGVKGVYSLHDSEHKRIELLQEEYSIEEALLRRDISEVIENYGVTDEKDEVIAGLAHLYESNYSLNLSEFTYKEGSIHDLKDATEQLKALLSRLSGEALNNEEINDLLRSLVKIADASEILPRIAAGEVFSKVNDPDRLQRYVQQNIENKTILLDANVIFFMLLAHYDPKAEYNDSKYHIAVHFLSFLENSDLSLRTIPDYAIEIANLFDNALKLIPFSKLEVFTSLGGSRNPIYQFYQHLSDNHILPDGVNSFEGFLADFKFLPRTRVHVDYRDEVQYLLDSLGIELEGKVQYNYSGTIELLREDLARNGRSKTQSALKSDAIVFERLADRDSAINPVDPIFCTWDSSLYHARKKYFELHPGCTKWYMFSPTRLMDHVSMMSFQIKPGVMSNEILSIIDGEQFQHLTHSLLDAIASIININNETGLKYTNMVAKIREQEILEINKTDAMPESVQEQPAVDLIFKTLFDKYIIGPESTSALFKRLFTTEKYFEDFAALLLSEKSYVQNNKVVSENLTNTIDAMLGDIKQTFKS